MLRGTLEIAEDDRYANDFACDLLAHFAPETGKNALRASAAIELPRSHLEPRHTEGMEVRGRPHALSQHSSGTMLAGGAEQLRSYGLGKEKLYGRLVIGWGDCCCTPSGNFGLCPFWRHRQAEVGDRRPVGRPFRPSGSRSRSRSRVVLWPTGTPMFMSSATCISPNPPRARNDSMR